VLTEVTPSGAGSIPRPFRDASAVSTLASGTVYVASLARGCDARQHLSQLVAAMVGLALDLRVLRHGGAALLATAAPSSSRLVEPATDRDELLPSRRWSDRGIQPVQALAVIRAPDLSSPELGLIEIMLNEAGARCRPAALRESPD